MFISRLPVVPMAAHRRQYLDRKIATVCTVFVAKLHWKIRYQ